MTEGTNAGDPLDRDYHQIYTPEDKPKSEWSTNERRAWLLTQIEKTNPSDIKQVEVADEFGVSNVTIHKDINILKEWITKNMDYEAEYEVMRIFNKAMDQLEDDDPEAAVEVAMQKIEFLQSVGEMHEEPDKKEIDQDVKASGEVDITFSSPEDE